MRRGSRKRGLRLSLIAQRLMRAAFPVERPRQADRGGHAILQRLEMLQGQRRIIEMAQSNPASQPFGFSKVTAAGHAMRCRQFISEAPIAFLQGHTGLRMAGFPQTAAAGCGNVIAADLAQLGHDAIGHPRASTPFSTVVEQTGMALQLLRDRVDRRIDTACAADQF